MIAAYIASGAVGYILVASVVFGYLDRHGSRDSDDFEWLIGLLWPFFFLWVPLVGLLNILGKFGVWTVEKWDGYRANRVKPAVDLPTARLRKP
jgi:hypothetical protein